MPGFSVGRSAQIGSPDDDEAAFDDDPESMPGMEEPMFLGDDDLDDEDVYGPPVRSILTRAAGNSPFFEQQN